MGKKMEFCLYNKAIYKNRSEAEQRIVVKSRSRPYLRVYKCDVCGYYHITSQRSPVSGEHVESKLKMNMYTLPRE